jgi:hypothetical protein
MVNGEEQSEIVSDNLRYLPESLKQLSFYCLTPAFFFISFLPGTLLTP